MMNIINTKEVLEFINVQRTRENYSETTIYFKSKIEQLLVDNHVDFHIIEARVKEISSLRRKLDKKESNENISVRDISKLVSSNETEITDLSGVRIIVFFFDDVRSIVNLICSNYSIDEQNSNFFLSNIEYDKFGYQSIHVIVKYETIKIEVQVRTVLQHAWAAISHKTEYKSETVAPYQLKRKLSRLAGLIEIADVEFNDLKVGYSLNGVDERSQLLLQPLDYISLNVYFSVPNRFLRYITYCEFQGRGSGTGGISVQHEVQDCKGFYKQIIELCKVLGFVEVSDLDRFLRTNLLKFKQSIRLFMEYRGIVSTFFTAGQRLIVLLHLELNYDDIDKLKNDPDYEEYFDIVLRVKRKMLND